MKCIYKQFEIIIIIIRLTNRIEIKLETCSATYSFVKTIGLVSENMCDKDFIFAFIHIKINVHAWTTVSSGRFLKCSRPLFTLEFKLFEILKSLTNNCTYNVPFRTFWRAVRFFFFVAQIIVRLISMEFSNSQVQYNRSSVQLHTVYEIKSRVRTIRYVCSAWRFLEPD
jgi:hypothetical protein